MCGDGTSTFKREKNLICYLLYQDSILFLFLLLLLFLRPLEEAKENNLTIFSLFTSLQKSPPPDNGYHKDVLLYKSQITVIQK